MSMDETIQHHKVVSSSTDMCIYYICMVHDT